jgi:hypothetical protein
MARDWDCRSREPYLKATAASSGLRKAAEAQCSRSDCLLIEPRRRRLPDRCPLAHPPRLIFDAERAPNSSAVPVKGSKLHSHGRGRFLGLGLVKGLQRGKPVNDQKFHRSGTHRARGGLCISRSRFRTVAARHQCRSAHLQVGPLDWPALRVAATDGVPLCSHWSLAA